MSKERDRETRRKINDLMDLHCKGCNKIVGKHKNCGLFIYDCDNCDIHKQLRELGQTIWTVSPERKRRSVGEWDGSAKDGEIMAEKERGPKPKDGPGGKTKQDYLNELAAGKSVTDLLKEWGIAKKTLEYWRGKWGLHGRIDQARAVSLLDDSESKDQWQPTSETYYKVCQELEDQRKRADKAEAELECMRSLSADPDRVYQNDDYPFPTITLTFPLLDFGCNRIEQLEKCKEEIGEYSFEIKAADIDMNRAKSEFFDVGQSLVGLIRKQLQELMVEDVDGAVKKFFQHGNQEHLEKMMRRMNGER